MFRRIFLFAGLIVSISFFSAFSQSKVTATKGTEFWFGYMTNYYQNAGQTRYDVFISSDRNTSGTIYAPAIGWQRSFSVQANVTTTVTLPFDTLSITASDLVENKGIQIITNDTVSIYAINFEQYTSDGTLVLPVQSIGTEYIITSYKGVSTYGSEALIVATKDLTKIEIVPSCDLEGGKLAGVPYTITLNKGQSYQMRSLGTGLDLTGTRIHNAAEGGACRPFAVFSGARCADVPGGYHYCDHLFEAEYPTVLWGREYILPPFKTTAHYTYKVLALNNGTTITINGTAVATLNAGQYREFNFEPGAVYIEGDQPISVVQFMEGSDANGADPSQLVVSPVDQILRDVTFTTVTSNVITSHFFNIIVKTADVNSVFLDGIYIGAFNFNQVPSNTQYSYAAIQITQGSHHIKSDSGFIAYAYGTGDDESYAYALGSFAPIYIVPTDTVFCSTESVTFTPPEVINNPIWYAQSDTSNILGNNISFSLVPNHAEVYVVEGADQYSGCRKKYQFHVDVPTPPNVDLTASSNVVCKFQDVILNANIDLPSQNYTFSWSPVSSNTDTSVVQISPTKSGWYHLTVESNFGCAKVSDSVYVTVNNGSFSKVNVSPDSATYCQGVSTNLSFKAEKVIFFDDFNTPISSSNWANVSGATLNNLCGSVAGDALYFNGAGTRVAQTKPLNTLLGGSLNFFLKIANGLPPCDNAEPGEGVVLEYSINGGANWSTLGIYDENQYPDITFISIPIPASAKTNATIFKWRQVSNSGVGQDNWILDDIFIGGVTSSGYSFSWQPSTGLTSGTTNPTTATLVGEETYYLLLTDSSTGCIYKDSVRLNVGQQFSLLVDKVDTICQSSSYQVTANPSIAGNYTYQWSPDYFFDDDSVQTPTVVNLNSSQVFTVNAVSGQGCTASETISVYVPKLVKFYVTPDLDSICTGESVQFNTYFEPECGTNGNTCSGTTTYQVGSGTSSTNTNGTTPFNGSAKSARYQFIITKAELLAAGISLSTTITKIGINVSAIAGTNIYKNLNIKMGCTSLTSMGNSFTEGLATVYSASNSLLVTGVNNFTLTNSFDWNGESNLIIEMCYLNTAASANSSVVFSNTAFNSTLSITSGSSACGISSGNVFTKRPNFYLYACNSPALPALSYSWSPSLNLSGTTIGNPVASPVTTTVYSLTATDGVSTCLYRDRVSISVGTSFTINLPDTLLYCNSSGIKLSPEISVPGTYSYFWSPNQYISSVTSPNPVVTPPAGKWYYLTITNPEGCSKTDSVFVKLPPAGLSTFYLTPEKDTACLGTPVQLNCVFNNPCGTNGSPCTNPGTYTLGTTTQNSSLVNITPYKGATKSGRLQFLVTKNDLLNIGISGPITLSDLGFDITQINGNNIYENFTIKMKCTSLGNLVTNFESGLQTVFNPQNVLLTTGVNYYNFNNTFDWDGNSNLIIDICFQNSVSSANSAVTYHTANTNTILYSSGNSECNIATGTATSSIPNIYFKGCYNNFVNKLDINWSPITGLSSQYSPNPLATPLQTTTYIVNVLDTATGCSYSDSAKVYTSVYNPIQLVPDTVICRGDKLNIDIGSGYNSYSWSTGGTGSSINISSSGNYFVSAKDYCYSYSDTISVSKGDTLATLDLGPDKVLCGGAFTLDVTENGILSYLWQDGSSDSLLEINSAGTYWLLASSRCNALSDTIRVDFLKGAVFLGKDTVICDSSVLNAGSGYTSYQWQNGSSDSIFSVTQSGQYFVTVSNACGIFSDTINIIIGNRLEDISFNDTTLCSGTLLNYTLDISIYPSITWQDTTTGGAYSINQSGTYKVSASNICGALVDTFRVTYEMPVAIDLGVDKVLCNVASINLTVPSSSVTYIWQDGTISESYTATASGQYFVSAINTCGSGSDTINLQFNNSVSINLGNDTVLCNNASLLLNMYQPEIQNYQWQDGSTDSIYSINTAGVYSLTVTTPCETLTDSIMVSYYQSAELDLGNDTTICAGTTLTLDAGTGFTSYLWQDNSISQTVTTNGDSIYWVQTTDICGIHKDTIVIDHVPDPYLILPNDTAICLGQSVILFANTNTDTHYWSDGNPMDSIIVNVTGVYIMFGYNQCGSTIDTAIVIVKSPPVVNLGNDQILCTGQQYLLDAYSPENTGYLWQDGTSGTSYIVDSSGIYWVSISNMCGSYKDTVKVDYLPDAFVNIGTDTALCPGESITLMANAIGAVLWSNGSTYDTLTVSLPGSVWVTASNQCGAYTDTVQIDYLGYPDVYTGNDTSICKGNNVQFSAVVTNATNMTWQDGTTGNVYTASFAGTYWLTANNRCGTSTDTIRIINVYPLPVVNLGEDTIVCANASRLLSVKINGATCQWQDGSTNTIYNVTQGGNYSVVVTDSNNCEAYDEIVINELSKPVLRRVTDTTLCYGHTMTLAVSPVYASYLWSNGDSTYYTTINDRGQYMVKATNFCGYDSAFYNVEVVECDCNVTVPTAFSPNNDGMNDVLYVLGRCIGTMEFIIYDRWGEKIFVSNSLNEGWDGTYKGQALNSATFVYYLKVVSSFDAREIIKEGSVILVR